MYCIAILEPVSRSRMRSGATMKQVRKGGIVKSRRYEVQETSKGLQIAMFRTLLFCFNSIISVHFTIYLSTWHAFTFA